jgi:osmotically-inducible protein OsmY
MMENVGALTTNHTNANPPARSGSVADAITAQLKTSGYRTLHDVRCCCPEGVAILQGRVPSFYLKQLAQVLASRVSGVERVVNQVKVEDSRASTFR